MGPRSRDQPAGLASPCPRCAAPAREWIRAYDRTGHPNRPVRRCTGCGIGFTSPPPGEEPAAPTRLPPRGPLRVYADHIIRRELTPLTTAIAPDATVLDIGAGGGDRALVLALGGHRVTAVEPDPDEAARARRQLEGRGQLLTGTIQELPADASGYDAALLSHVLEHLPDPDEALRLIRERLRPGGAIAIMVPNAGGLQARIFGGRWHQWEPSRHRWHFTREVLGEMLARAGYRHIGVRASGGWRYPASLAYSIAPRLDPQTPGSPPATVGHLFALALVPLALAEAATGRGSQLVATARAPG
jgi:SAM-dependent methyltransferase